MTHCRFSRWFFFGLYVSLAWGCAYPISSGLRQAASKNLTFSMVLQDPAAHEGAIVIWGGEIITTTNLKDGTEILILHSPLNYQLMPAEAALSLGRFIARSPQFLDPALYKSGKKITVAGEIAGKETRPLGQTEYTYPLVQVKELHLWERSPYGLYYQVYNPFWDWDGLHYGP